MKAVTSRMFSAIGYDKDTRRLRMQYAKGGAYDHADVPKEIYEALMAAESVGKYFLANIRNQYPGVKYVPEEVTV